MKVQNTKLVLALSLLLPMAAHAVAADGQPARQASHAAVSTHEVKPSAADAPRQITLQGAWNARTFAGLQGANGPIPANAFVRTGDLGRLTAADRHALAAMGVTLDIDLRTADEKAQSPDLLEGDSRFDYQRISLLGVEKMDMEEVASLFPNSLGESYVQSLGENKPQFKQVFQLIAGQQDGVVLFHCTAGKDRTGMVAALLLDLAGVSRAQIVHNYAISAYYLKDQPKDTAMNVQFEQFVRQHPEVGKKMAGLAGSGPENIEMFLNALYAQYGNAENYLKSIGVSAQQIQRLKVRLGQAS